MVLYSCKHCNFTSKLKTDYKRHLKTKKHQRNINPDYNIEEEMTLKTQKDPQKTQKDPQKTQKDPKRPGKIKKFSCIYCNELFTTYAHKRRHELHRCPDLPIKDMTILELKKDKENLKKDKENLEKDKKKLEKRVEKLTDRIGNTTNIQTNTTNTNNNNIKINSYGQEDLSHITDAFKTSLLSGPYGAIPKLIEAIHFNNDKPENKNVILPNLNKNILKIKKGEKWVHKNKDLILLDLIDSKYLMLDDHFNLIVNGEILSKFTKDIYSKFRDKYDDGDKGLMSEIKENCNLIMMDHKEN